jgi:hypothetical protein
MRAKIYLVFVFIFVYNALIAQNTIPDFSKLNGPYLGQTPPGLNPVLFAPGYISTRNTEWTLTFMPGGNEAYYTIQGLNSYNHLICVKSINGIWQQPELASFSNPDHNADPYISPDGKKLFFWSNGPEKAGEESGNNSDIFYVNRIGDGWSKTIRLDSIINTKQWQIFPTVALNGNLYFTCNYSDTKGGFDVYKSEFVNGKYTKPVNLGDSINTSMLEQEPYIAPDESYLIFASDRHAPRTTNWDLYISFRKKDGSWTKAINMGDKINSPATDQAAIVTSDGKYLFFSSCRVKKYNPAEKDFSYKAIIDALNGPQNGNSDVYWVDAKVIDGLKSKNK